MSRPNTSIIGYRAQGKAILDRLAEEKTSATLKGAIKAFAAANKGYDDQATKVDDARGLRDGAIQSIGEADAVLDTSVLALADLLVTAKLGTRKNPFAAFSKYPPETLTNLAYMNEVMEVEKLGAAIIKKKPTAEVKAGVATCLKNAAAVKTALGAINKPQAGYTKAIIARDSTLLAWQKALGQLKKHVAAEWDDDPARVKAIFAPPSAMQAPAEKPKRKGKADKKLPTT